MDSDQQNLSLGEATSRFLLALPPDEKGGSQQEIYKFVRWFGGERLLPELTGAQIANYAERLSLSDTDYAGKLELIRALFTYAKKKGWTQTNLAVHLKFRKGKAKSGGSSGQPSSEAVPMTQQGYLELEAELASLQNKRQGIIEEIRRAAADKDFRENAPLAAAREERGHLEGRIVELEATLKAAVVIDEKTKVNFTIGIGDRVTICEVNTGAERCYTLVSSKEADPSQGKVSSASPIGQAVIGRNQGEIVEVVAPAGKLRYQIKQVEQRANSTNIKASDRVQ